MYKTKTQNTNNRIPLVLTYHPMTKKVQHIIQRNFSILQDDPSTAPIFNNPPLMSYRRDKNLREHLVHSNIRPNLDSLKGMFPCNRSRCATCKYIHSNTVVKGAKSSFTIHDTFTCISKGIVYCIGCIKCNKLYIGETRRRMADRFVEHLRSIRINTSTFPVARHFNRNDHTIEDITICGMVHCYGTKAVRKQKECELIFKLGTFYSEVIIIIIIITFWNFV